jgi:hypothetical protein
LSTIELGTAGAALLVATEGGEREQRDRDTLVTHRGRAYSIF